MKIEQVLKGLGLVKSEAKIYRVLIGMPLAQPASVIASRSGINRTTAYKALLKLVKMGLVTKTMRHGIICFIAENPEKNLEELLINQKNKLNYLTDLFQDALPDLQNLKRQELFLPQMRYYEGIEGVKRVYEDTLVEGKTIYAFENIEVIDVELQKYLTQHYIPKRLEKNIFAYCITPKNPKCQEYRDIDKKINRKTRFLPKSQFPIEVEINVYGNKTAFFSYKTEEMFGVILESPAIANTLKSLFNVCWKVAK